MTKVTINLSAEIAKQIADYLDHQIQEAEIMMTEPTYDFDEDDRQEYGMFVTVRAALTATGMAPSSHDSREIIAAKAFGVTYIRIEDKAKVVDSRLVLELDLRGALVGAAVGMVPATADSVVIRQITGDGSQLIG